MININIKYKKKFFKINIKKNEMELLSILLKINYIKYAKKINDSTFVIFPNLRRNNFFFVKNLYKPSNLIKMRKKELIETIIKKKQIIILSTSSGLKLVSKKNQCFGGLLIAKLLFN